MRSGYQLTYYRSQHEPYGEDYSLDTQGLLTQALKQVSQELERRSVLFVGDTSLRIEALKRAHRLVSDSAQSFISNDADARAARNLHCVCLTRYLLF
jgi:hypothetical protein